ncbi:MAG: endonuclease/exonuclease/phosphatase family protein [Candidatus Thiodiazotropha sp.]
MTWNIEGALAKLQFSDVISYLNTFDIFALLETWVTRSDLIENVFVNHTCYFCAAVKPRLYGPAKAGIAVYVRRDLCINIRRVYPDCDFAVFLQLDRHVLNLAKDILFCFVYLPPDNSPFYHDKCSRGIILLENQLLELHTENVHLVVAGDLNARTAEKRDYIEFVNNVPDLEEYDEILNVHNNIPDRVSCDKITNKFGSDLINFCKSYSLLIVNGRVGEDR